MDVIKQVPIICRGHTRPIMDLDFSGITVSSYLMISGSKDAVPMLREGDTGDWIGSFIGHKGAVWGVKIDKPGLLAATASADFTTKIWDARGGQMRASFEEHHVVRCVDLSQDGRLMITGSMKNSISIYDIETEKRILSLCEHTDSLNKVAFIGEHCYVSASSDGFLNFYDGREADVVYDRLSLGAPIIGLECNPERGMLTLAHSNHVSIIKNFRSSDRTQVDVPCEVSSASVHPIEDRFVCGGADFKLYVYSMSDLSIIGSYRSHFGRVHCVKYSPDGALFASGSEDGTIRLFQDKMSSSDIIQEQVFSLLNQAATFGNDAARADKLRQVRMLLVDENPSLMDNFLDEILAFQGDSCVAIRLMLVELIEDACRIDACVVSRVVDHLRYMLHDADVSVVKRVICVCCYVYRLGLRWLSRFKSGASRVTDATLHHLVGIKDYILTQLVRSGSDGVRIAAIRFMETVCLVQSAGPGGSSDDDGGGGGDDDDDDDDDFCLEQMGGGGSGLLDVDALASEGHDVFCSLLALAQSDAVSSVNLIVCVQSVCLIAARRPQKMFLAVQALEAIQSSIPRAFAASQVDVVRKHLKAELAQLLRVPAAAEFQRHLLSMMGASAADAPRRKRPAPGPAPESPPLPPPLPAPSAAAPKKPRTAGEELEVDVTDVLAALSVANAVDLTIASIANVPDRPPPAFLASYRPIEQPGSRQQVATLARMLAAQLTAAARLGFLEASPSAAAAAAAAEAEPAAPAPPPPAPPKSSKKLGGGGGGGGGAKAFKLADVTADMSYDEMNAMARLAFQRILAAEETARRYCVVGVRRKILSSLVCMPGQAYRDMYEEHIFADPKHRMDLAFNWIFHEYARMKGFTSAQHPAAAAAAAADFDSSKYEDVLARVLDNLRDPEALLLSTPEFPESVLAAVTRHCTDDDPDDQDAAGGGGGGGGAAHSSSVAALREMVLVRQPGTRLAFLRILLGLAQHPHAVVRTCALNSLVSLYDEAGADADVLDRVQEAALEGLDALTQLAADADDAAAAVDTRSALFFAVLARKPALVHSLTHAYALIASDDVKKSVMLRIEEPMQCMDPRSPEIDTLVESCPDPAIDILVRVLNIVSEAVDLSQPLTQKVQRIAERHPLNPHLIIPILTTMDKAEIPAAISTVLKLTEPEVRHALKRIIRNKAFGPVELLVLLHKIPFDSPDLKMVICAIGICFANKTAYNLRTVTNAFKKLLTLTPVPVLLMRSILQAVAAHPLLSPTIMDMLDGFANQNKLWEIPKLWDGFIKCCQRCRPYSYPVLLKLPGEKLAELIRQNNDIAIGIWSFLNDATLTAKERQRVPPEILQAICALQNQQQVTNAAAAAAAAAQRRLEKPV